MRRSTLLTPIGMLIAGCMMIALLFAQPNAGSRAAPLGDISSYPPPTQTAIANLTATAQARQSGNGSYPAPSSVVTSTATVTPTNNSGAPTATLASPTRTLTPNPDDFEAVTNTPQRSDNADADVTATSQGTATPTLDPNTRACAPGDTVAISGEGPANAGFLVYFDGRVVSGGTVRRDGRFEVGLTVGAERGGNYPVEVRVRGTRTVLTKFICQVPATTPTPIAPRAS